MEDKPVPDTRPERKTSLNENHVRRLRVTCEHIDELLCRIEVTLNAAVSKAAFPRYNPDLSPVQKKTIEDYIARIRARLIQVLDTQQIPRKQPSVSVSRAVDATLISVDIAVEELKPKYMEGYGELPDDLATVLNGISGELHSLVMQVSRYLAEGAGQDFTERMRRLEQEGNDLALLRVIGQIVNDRGLVEFRGAIAAILDRAEDRNFEIAVFGRVSSGKSSLLNSVLGTDILPVGVTPVTAVPTRIICGEAPALSVSFADRPARTEEAGKLSEYASEQGNPGNAKHVTRITVTLPSACLGDGIAFVDTPGLGSLATHGAEETLAYLPKCDLGVVLIDAGSTLTEGDLHTIRALQEAAVPVQVLLSKADLLSGGDCATTIRYVKQQIAAELGLDLPVHPVSVRPTHRNLVDQWFADEIHPLTRRAQELRQASLQRKIGALRASVTAALRIRLRRSRQAAPVDPEKVRAAEARLCRATGLIEEARTTCRQKAGALEHEASRIFSKAAARMLSAKANAENPAEDPDAVRATALAFAQERAKDVQETIETLARRLRRELTETAAGLGSTDVPGEDDFFPLVRGMPVFDTGPVRTGPAGFQISALFGKRIAQDQLAARIRQETGGTLMPALKNYGKVLESWGLATIDPLGRKFESYAGRYRAQAEQLLNGGVVSEAEARAIEKDLRVLSEGAGSS